MEQKGLFWDFLTESITRLFTKSPKYFKYWQLISIILLGSAKIPDWLLLFHITVPQLYDDKVKIGIMCGSAVGLWMSRLASQSKLKLDEKGNIVKTTNEEKLPFTAKSEANALLKQIK